MTTVTTNHDQECHDPPLTPRQEHLHSDDVLELQAFIKRKQWIQDKIQFLESLPNLDIFAGIEQLSHEHQDLRPTKEQLAAWCEEHDALERETDQFDAGDMAKLRKFAKAATQRDLSPKDTDLIEVTLDTLVALDKLFHLLRSRSDRLELLGLRLEWENQWRLGSFASQKIISDIREFVQTRTSWSPSVLHDMQSETSSLVNSNGDASKTSRDLSTTISRHPWYRQIETLSHEAATFSDRTVLLQETSVAASGKVLDKLIDLTPTPVPEVVLDEQEKLENTCNVELDNISNFVMSVVVQWRKSAETYGELQQDQQAAAALEIEIKDANKRPPITSTALAFQSRASALSQRASLRIDLRSPAAAFPQPKHNLFPEQDEKNKYIINILSDEIRKTRELAHRSLSWASAFMHLAQVYQKAEDVISDAKTTISRAENLAVELRGKTGDISSSRPDFSSPECLDNHACALYASSLPAIQDQMASLEAIVARLMDRLRSSITELQDYAHQDSIRQTLVGVARELESSWTVAMSERDSALEAIDLLKRSRLLWAQCKHFQEQGAAILSTLHLSCGVLLNPEVRGPVDVDGKALGSSNDDIDEALRRLDELGESIAKDVDDLPVLHDHFVAQHQQIRQQMSFLRQFSKVVHRLHERHRTLESLEKDARRINGLLSDLISTTESAANRILVEGADEGSEDLQKELMRKLADIQNDLGHFLSTLPGRMVTLDWPFSPAKNALVQHFADALLPPLLLDPPPLNVEQLNEVARSEFNSHVAVLSQLRQIAEDRIGSLSTALVAHALIRKLECFEEALSVARRNHSQYKSTLQSFESQSDSDGVLSSEIIDTTSHFTERTRTVIDLGKEEITQLATQVASQSVAKEFHDRFKQHLASLEARTKVAHEDSAAVLFLIGSLEGDCEGAMRRRKEQQEESEARALESAGVAEQSSAASASHSNVEADEPVAVERHDPAVHNDMPSSNAEDPDRTIPDIKGPDLAQTEDMNSTASAKNILDEALAPNFEHNVQQSESNSVGSSVEESNSEQCRTLCDRLGNLPFFNLSTPENNALPSVISQILRMEPELEVIGVEFAALSPRLVDKSQDDWARLATNLEVSKTNLRALRSFSELVRSCDKHFSNLLECVDRLNDPTESREDCAVLVQKTQDAAKLEYDRASHCLAAGWNAPCTRNELGRLSRMWTELQEMIDEGLSGETKSADVSGRSSVVSSTSEFSFSSAPPIPPGSPTVKRRKSHGPFLVPSTPSRPRHPSTLTMPQSLKKISQRSVSGPVSSELYRPEPLRPNSTLHHSTFASRSRTNSTSSSANVPVIGAPKKMRAISAQYHRAGSPASSEASVSSRFFRDLSKSPSLRVPYRPQRTPHQTPSRTSKPKKYVANPTNKLDVAVGNVVNNLSVPVSIEAVSDGWRDQSGKYWIGDSEPKLCYCRILRSQTVMVRVGGGWEELSRFIEDHFAESFRVLNTGSSPPRAELPWISAGTLAASESRPRTPERPLPSVPSFTFSTPSTADGKLSPPLTPLQFMRRADMAAAIPSTPAKTIPKGRLSHGVPSSAIVWKP